MKTRKANTKTATPTPPKKAAAAKAAQNSTTANKAQPSSKVPAENSLPEAGKSKLADVKSPEVLEEKSNADEQEKAVLKEEDAKAPVLAEKGLEDKNVPVGSQVEIPGDEVEDGAAVAEAKAGEQSAGDLIEKTVEKDEEEEKGSAENLTEANPLEEEKKDDTENEAEVPDANAVDEYSELQNEMSMPERRKRKKLEVFVGGLDKEATEDDLRPVFEKMGVITELRLVKNFETGKNKGYGFVRYSTPEEAKRALQELSNIKIRGKKCGVVPHEEKDSVFIGNIDKNWTKDDVLNKLKEVGVENIIDVTVIEEPNNPGINRGFAFLELETYKDAQVAFRTLVQKRNAFGEDRTIKVAWAQPLNEPDEDVMAQVKSVFVAGLQPTWNEEQVKEHFGRFGEIERVVLASNMQSAKRKDFGFVNYTTREAAIACIEKFSKDDELIDGDSKVKVKVSLAKPAPRKGKAGKGKSKGTKKGDPKGGSKGVSQGQVVKNNSSNQSSTTAGAVGGKGPSEGHVVKNQSLNQSSTTSGAVGGKGLLGKGHVVKNHSSNHSSTATGAGGGKGLLGEGHVRKNHSSNHSSTTAGAVGGKGLLGEGGQPALPSTTHEILHILRQQAAWGQGHAAVSGGHVGGIEQAYTVPNVQPMSSVQGYGHALQGVKRSYTALGDVSVNSRGNPRARLESTIVPGSSSHGLSARVQGSLSNPMFAGASVQQLYPHPSIGTASGGPYAPGSASYAPIGLQGGSLHFGHRGGASSHG